MKPAAFSYERPRSVAEVVALLASSPGAKILAGGQTLGPMLNLRLAQPSALVDITRIPELVRVEERRDALVIGACVTHAAIEDRRLADVTNGFLCTVARGIAYRAVRTRGTIGGSLAHADPAADWLICLTALGAKILIDGPQGQRIVAVADFMRGVFDTDLAADEVVEAVKIPRLSAAARCGFHKICRKTGEFADAIGAFVHDPEQGVTRFVSGATNGRPIVLDGAQPFLDNAHGAADPPSPATFDIAAAMHCLKEAGLENDFYELKIHAVALKRALGDAQAP